MHATPIWQLQLWACAVCIPEHGLSKALAYYGVKKHSFRTSSFKSCVNYAGIGPFTRYAEIVNGRYVHLPLATLATCCYVYAVCYPGAFFTPFANFPFLVYRAAMLGYVILAYVEYNQELRKAALLVYSQLQQQGSGSIGL